MSETDKEKSHQDDWITLHQESLKTLTLLLGIVNFGMSARSYDSSSCSIVLYHLVFSLTITQPNIDFQPLQITPTKSLSESQS